MNLRPVSLLISLIQCVVVLITISCGNIVKPPDKDVVNNPEDLEDRITENIQQILDYSIDHASKFNDSIHYKSFHLSHKVYSENGFKAIWSNRENWLPIADSLFYLLEHVSEYGLFSSDYSLPELIHIKGLIRSDSLNRKDAALWANADILLTTAFLNIAKDLKLGRLQRDSVTLRNDSLLKDDFFINHFGQAVTSTLIKASLQELEPANKEYHKLKTALKGFLLADTLGTLYADSLQLQFNRIALTLDKYKQLPETLPSTFLWVNIPSYSLRLQSNDSIVLQSKVIVGRPATRTPVLNSSITNFITYPQWTVPYSIVFKEMLPGIKKDMNYLNKHNLMVVDKNDSVIDPATIDWSKLSRTHFPYLLRQRQGDDNSLGVMKFNFSNKYSVYLHDTNARSLFARTSRALSHGCVRVEKWKLLADFLIRDDTLRHTLDSLNIWMERAEKRLVPGFKAVPIYIRYYTVEGEDDGALKFYKDIYKEDSILNAKYFSGKRY